MKNSGDTSQDFSQPNVGKKLKNVKFQVLDKNKNILETIITDENGEAVTSKYALKDYNELYLKDNQGDSSIFTKFDRTALPLIQY